MFQLPHLIVLAVTAALIPVVWRRASRLDQAAAARYVKVCALLAVLFDPVYWVWEIRSFGSIDPATTLPLYLCSLFWLLLPLAAFAREGIVRQTAAASLCTIVMLCGVLGLVFNVYLNHYPFFSFVPLRSLLYHMLMILVPTGMWASGYYRPQPRDRFLFFIPVLLLVAVSLPLNRLYGWDYCYTAGGIGTPLALLSARMPKIFFLLLLYGSLLLIIQFLFYRRFSRLAASLSGAARNLADRSL